MATSTHTLWRLPFSGRLHASKKCRLLKAEGAPGSPADYERHVASMMARRHVANLPISQEYKRIWEILPHLCSCADHLRKR